MTWTSDEAGIYAFVQRELGKHLSGNYSIDKGYESKVFSLADPTRALVDNFQYGKNVLGGYKLNKPAYGMSINSLAMYGTPDARYH